MLKSLIAILILIMAGGLLQQTSWLSVFGVKPDLVLATLVTAAVFVESWWLFILLAFLGGAFLRFAPGYDFESLTVAALALIGCYVQRFLPWHKLINVALLIALATILFYAIIDWQFLIGYAGLVLAEIVYNIGAGAAVFGVLKLLK